LCRLVKKHANPIDPRGKGGVENKQVQKKQSFNSGRVGTDVIIKVQCPKMEGGRGGPRRGMRGVRPKEKNVTRTNRPAGVGSTGTTTTLGKISYSEIQEKESALL